MYHVNQNSWHGRVFVRNFAKLGLSEGDLTRLTLPGYLTTITAGSLLIFIRSAMQFLRLMILLALVPIPLPPVVTTVAILLMPPDKHLAFAIGYLALTAIWLFSAWRKKRYPFDDL